MNPVQQDIDARATAPRVTPADLEAEIASEHYFTAAEGVFGAAYLESNPPFVPPADTPETLSLLTFCVLVLKNGIKLVGESACVSAENFDAEFGRRLAREDALRKLWPLLGFRLADKLAAESVKRRNAASHDMQLDAGSGIRACSRCGASDISAARRSCTEQLERLEGRSPPTMGTTTGDSSPR